MMAYFLKLFPSDIGTPENLNHLLRIWIIQLVEEAADRGATRIEVRLMQKGSLGFEIIDNGEGMETAQFSTITDCLPERKENQRYQVLSLGD